MDNLFVSTAPDTVQAPQGGWGSSDPLQANVREFVRTLEMQTEQLSRFSAAAARVNSQQTAYRIVLMAKIEGVKVVSDLCNAAIQKANIT